jgi:hypothetical protein
MNLMPNYLERVAMSAAGAAGRARPPVAAPPLLAGTSKAAPPLEIDEELIHDEPSRSAPDLPLPPAAQPHPPVRNPSPVAAHRVAAPLPESVRRPAPPPPSAPAAALSPEPPVNFSRQPQPPATPSDTFTFEAFMPNVVVRIPKTLRPADPPPPAPPSEPPRPGAERILPRSTPSVTAQLPSPPSPYPPALPPPVPVTPSAPEHRPRLQVGRLDLQVINTPPARTEVRPARAAAASQFLESRFLERSRFRW